MTITDLQKLFRGYGRQRSARLRLYCFHHAGGMPAMFRTWGAALPAEIEVCAALLPGRETRFGEPAYVRLDPLLDALAPAIAASDLPFCIYGQSMGGLIAFEVARALRRAGSALPRQLFIACHRAPQIPRAGAPTHDLPAEELCARLEELAGTPPAVLENAELMDVLLPLIRSDFALCETYAYRDEPPLDVPLTVLGGLDDTSVPRAELEPWSAQTRARFSLRMLPGSHFLDQAQVIPQLARELVPLAAGLPAR